jgi:hypothetical protein
MPEFCNCPQNKFKMIEPIRKEHKDVYRADQVEIQRRAAAAWLALAEEDREKALEIMRAAAEMEDSTEKYPVTSGAIIPARELLGDLLVELKQIEHYLSLRSSGKFMRRSRFFQRGSDCRLSNFGSTLRNANLASRSTKAFSSQVKA